MNIILRESLSSQVQNSFNIVLQKTTGVYPFKRNSDIHQNFDLTFDIHSWGVSVRDETVHAKPVDPPHGTRQITTMSMTTKKRVIKKTAMLEFFGVQPTHLLTLTLPPERFEKLSDEEKVMLWAFAKSYFFKALQKKLSREVPEYGYFSFQEFQTRGAPHLHLIMKLYKMSKAKWKKWLAWFIATWKKALKWDDEKDGVYPAQGVDFQKLRYQDFRYARSYMTKDAQKTAPFEANWGRWWSVGGSFRLPNVSKQYDIKMSEEELAQMNNIIGKYHWLTWSKMKQLSPALYEEMIERIQMKHWEHDDTIKYKKYKCVYTSEELKMMNEVYWYEMELNEERLE